MDISFHIIYLYLLMSASLMNTSTKSIQREVKVKANRKWNHSISFSLTSREITTHEHLLLQYNGQDKRGISPGAPRPAEKRWCSHSVRELGTKTKMVGRDLGQCQTMSNKNIRKIQKVLQTEIVLLSVHASSHWGGCTRSVHHGIPKLPGDLPSTHLFLSPYTSLHSAFSQC